MFTRSYYTVEQEITVTPHILYNLTVCNVVSYPIISFCFLNNAGYNYYMNFQIKCVSIRLGNLKR